MMKNKIPSSLPILVAIPNEWLKQVCQSLEDRGYSVISANSQKGALDVIEQQKELRGVIIVSDWAISNEKEVVSLVDLLQGKIPTITIITEKTRLESGYRYMDEIFFPPTHEYVTEPFSVEELEGRMRITGMANT